jgi:hypothetical protein
VHDHIAGGYPLRYAPETSGREVYRRTSNGEQQRVVVNAALAHSVSREWKGYRPILIIN